MSVAMTTASEPDGAPRVAGLDILRGLAILGILFMNINDMGSSIWAFWSQDVRHPGWSGADQIVWFVREVFADGTARCLLEMLFGVGMVILTDRAADAAQSRWALLRAYYWRNVVLFAFGLIHVFILLWPGDILHTYGLAALVAVWFRRLQPKALLTIGLVATVLQLIGGGIGYVMVPGQKAQVARLEAKQASGAKLTSAEVKSLATGQKAEAKATATDAENADRIASEDVARSAATGSFSTWARSAYDFFLHLQSKGLEALFVWEAVSTMLIGAALYKLGIIQGARSRRYYIKLTIVAYAIGLGSRAIGALQTMRFDDGPTVLWSLSEVARLATTIGHVGLVYVLLASVTGAKLLRPFEAAGRTALTIYILQTVVCLWILYPPFALGLYGTQGWAALMATAVVINGVLLWWANWYLRHYRIAPVEWAWRSIVAGKRLPFRKRVPLEGEGVPVAA